MTSLDFTAINSRRPPIYRTTSTANDGPAPPITPVFESSQSSSVDAVLELSDGSTFRGISFGAEGKSVAGECVFQTGPLRYLL
jgi:carbamoyl-phosphate synthase/aspartate carbamoyltransferase